MSHETETSIVAVTGIGPRHPILQDDGVVQEYYRVSCLLVAVLRRAWVCASRCGNDSRVQSDKEGSGVRGGPSDGGRAPVTLQQRAKISDAQTVGVIISAQPHLCTGVGRAAGGLTPAHRADRGRRTGDSKRIRHHGECVGPRSVDESVRPCAPARQTGGISVARHGSRVGKYNPTHEGFETNEKSSASDQYVETEDDAVGDGDATKVMNKSTAVFPPLETWGRKRVTLSPAERLRTNDC